MATPDRNIGKVATPVDEVVQRVQSEQAADSHHPTPRDRQITEEVAAIFGLGGRSGSVVRARRR